MVVLVICVITILIFIVIVRFRHFLKKIFCSFSPFIDLKVLNSSIYIIETCADCVIFCDSDCLQSGQFTRVNLGHFSAGCGAFTFLAKSFSDSSIVSDNFFKQNSGLPSMVPLF